MLNYHFCTIIISNMPTGKTGFIFNVNHVNVNMSVPNSTFEGNFSTYVFGFFLALSRAEKWLLDIATFIMRKNIKLLQMCGHYNSSGKVKYIWISHLPVVISTNMMIGNDFFVFKYPFKCKQKFPNSHYFYFYEGNRFTFMCAPPNEKNNL